MKSSTAGLVLLGVVVLAVGALLFVRNPRLEPILPSKLSDKPESFPAKVSDKLNIDFYLDASSSIAGFLPPKQEPPEQTNHFVDLLKFANSYLSNNWPDVTVSYWRFGEGEPKRVSSVSEFINNRYHPEKRDPNFEFNDKETHIDAAIDAPTTNSRDELKIIVTDLFQNETDIGRVLDKLIDRYLKSPDKAVSVLGIRNEFFGKIYDFPGPLDILPEGAADSLPFYVVICGKLPDVQHATELLKEKLNTGAGADSTLSIVYSSHPIAEPTQPLKVEESKDGTYTVYTDLVEGAAKESVPQVEISKGKKVDLHLKDFPGDAVTNVVHAAFKKAPPKITAQLWDQRQKAYVKFLADDPDKPAFAADSAGTTITVDGTQLQRKAIYLVSLDLEAAKGDLSEVKSWGTTDFSRILKQQKFDETNGRHPGKTPYLKNFLGGLLDRVFQFKNPVPLARYYLYVKVI